MLINVSVSSLLYAPDAAAATQQAIQLNTLDPILFSTYDVKVGEDQHKVGTLWIDWINMQWFFYDLEGNQTIGDGIIYNEATDNYTFYNRGTPVPPDNGEWTLDVLTLWGTLPTTMASANLADGDQPWGAQPATVSFAGFQWG